MLGKREVLSPNPSVMKDDGRKAEVEGQPEGLKESGWPKDEKPEGNYHMFGDRTVRSVGEISRELPHRRHWC